LVVEKFYWLLIFRQLLGQLDKNYDLCALNSKTKTMATKIRLQRRGKKGQPFYAIVVTDGRAPRDGKFIEKIGVYNPLTIPATIDVDTDRALYWVDNGAQPSETCEAILRYTGILYRKHLQIGVKKGAMTQEQADVKWNDWKRERDEKIAAKSRKVVGDKQSKKAELLKAEKELNEKRHKALAAKRSSLAAEAVAQDNSPEVVAEVVAEETIAAPKAEVEVTVEATPEAVVEATPEAVVEATPEAVVEPTPEAVC
jgi:small subunit ribosomal protein S16